MPDSSEVTCAICLDEFRDPKRLPCGHKFCAPCLRQWISTSLAVSLSVPCPLCRVPIDRAYIVFLAVALTTRRMTQRNVTTSVGSNQAQLGTTSVRSNQAQLGTTSVRSNQAQLGTTSVRSNQAQMVTTPVGHNQAQMRTTPVGHNQAQMRTTPVGSNQAQGNPSPDVSVYFMFVMIAAIFVCANFGAIVSGLNDMMATSSIQITKDPVTFSTYSGDLTMGLIRNEIFLINPATTQGQILDRKTLSYKSLWNVSDFFAIARNTFCKKNNYLYVSTTMKTILKFDSDGDTVAKWSTENAKGRPLIMADCNVAFIPHNGPKQIFIYTPYGNLIRVVQLKLKFRGPRLNCAVHLPNGNFLVSYGPNADAKHGLSLVNFEGNVLRSFEETKGRGETRVNGAYDLIAEEMGTVHVVDYNNHRIVRLNSDLEYLNQTLLTEKGVWFPHGALYDEPNHRIFVMGSSWNEKNSVLSHGKIIVHDIDG